MTRILCFITIAGLCSPVFADWESVGPFGGPLNTVEIAPSNENIIYVAMATFAMDDPIMMFKSIDQGDWWEKLNAPPMVSSIAIDPADPQIVYAGTGLGAVFKSTDGGLNWDYHPINNAMFILDIFVHPTNPAVIFAAGVINSSGLKMAFYKSTDSGINWTSTVLSPGSTGEARALAIDPSNPNTIYVGGQAGSSPKIHKSSNGGNSFTDVSGNIDPAGGAVQCLAVNPGNSNIVYATTILRGIYRTSNGGDSWTLVRNEESLTCLATTQAASSIVYAGKDTLILKSTDDGNNWFNPGSGYGGEATHNRGIAASQTNPLQVYSACRQGFFATATGGSAWYASNAGINMLKIIDIECAPSSPSKVYASTKFTVTDGPIYQSNDSGSTWSMTATPIPATGNCGTICKLASPVSDANTVFALEGMG